MTRTTNQRDGSFGYKAPHPSTNQKNRPFGLLCQKLRDFFGMLFFN